MSQFNNPSNQNYPLRRRGGGKPVLGVIIALLGAFFLIDQLDLFPDLDFMLVWPVILIMVGVMIGIKRKWNSFGPVVLIIVGVANLIPIFSIGGTRSNHLVWPIVMILIGLAIVFRQKKSSACETRRMEMVTNGESTLNIDVTMGGRKEIVTSKEFRGGKISTTFGGTEVNLMQADSTVQPIVLDINVSFGSVELIVPSHWDVINDIRPSMGSVEDHRHMRMADPGAEKRTLHLRGSCSFGSIEIKSY